MSSPSDDVVPEPPPAPQPVAAPDRRSIIALIDRPLVIAFVATLGVLGGLVLGSAIASITSILIYIVLALFIALGLDPIVRLLERRGVKRGGGIAIVFGAFAVLALAFFIFVLPPILAQVGQFIAEFPEAVQDAVNSEWFLALAPDLQDAVAAALAELSTLLAKPETIAAVGGGALRWASASSTRSQRASS